MLSEELQESGVTDFAQLLLTIHRILVHKVSSLEATESLIPGTNPDPAEALQHRYMAIKCFELILTLTSGLQAVRLPTMTTVPFLSSSDNGLSD
jgi:hypothetical protein